MSNEPRSGLAVAGLGLGTALNPLNSSMIAVALVVLRADFGLDVAAVTWVMGVPYGAVSIASNQGMFVSTRPQERGVAAGIFQTCRYMGAITPRC